MPRMIDLIRQSTVPAHIMRSAALGSLSLPAAEMIEILVFLTKSPIFGQQARMTLAGWDIRASQAAATDPGTPREVLEYMLAAQNRRPVLLPALLENPSVDEPALLEVAQADSRETVEAMLASARVRRSPNVLRALLANPHLSPEEVAEINSALAASSGSVEESPAGDVLDVGPTPYEIEHAAEIAAEEGREFELVDGTSEELAELTATEVTPPRPATDKHREERERLSPLQKIARLTVGERVQLAMKGNRDERYILIRDGSKIVSAAVLESPKVTDQEIEIFAGMKNVQESVLRGIAAKRKFMKNYAVTRALVNNPKCPLDISVALIKNLLVNDLKNLSINKNVPDTIRKLGAKLFHEKSTTKKGE